MHDTLLFIGELLAAFVVCAVVYLSWFALWYGFLRQRICRHAWDATSSEAFDRFIAGKPALFVCRKCDKLTTKVRE